MKQEHIIYRSIGLLFALLMLCGMSQPLYAQDIVAMEYFIDEDPGFGDAIPVDDITASPIVNHTFSVNLDGYDEGFHKLYVRSQDENGKWSLTHVSNFYKPPAPLGNNPDPLNIVAIEYFIDEDPGFGSGTAVDGITADEIVNHTFAAALNGYDEGFHKLYVRSQDENGKWSLTHVSNFYKPPAPLGNNPNPLHIVAIEYFIDEDPGFGSGTLVDDFTTAPIVNHDFAVAMNGLGGGEHQFYVRSKDANGVWSLTHVENFVAPDPVDAALLDFVGVNPLSFGNQSVTVQLKNLGPALLENTMIGWEVNGVVQAEYGWNGSLGIAEIEQVDIGAFDFELNETYDIKAWISNPNGNDDLDNANDTIVVNDLVPGLIGEYTLGGDNPDFQTFDGAVDTLHEFGVIGAVTFLVRNGTYNERISTNEIGGASAQNTVTFRSESGNANDVKLTFAGQYHVWRLDGTDYLSIEDMTIENTHSSDGRAISLTNNATHNSFSGNIFTNAFTDKTGYAYALVYDRSNFDNPHNSFTNNHFINGSFGIYSQSTSGNETEGTVINDNVFENQYYRGVYLKYHDGSQVQNNEVTTTVSDEEYRGLYFDRCDNALRISGNKIDLQTGGYAVSLNYCDGASSLNPGLIYNNFIHIGQGTDKAHGIRLYESTYQHIYFNSVNITHSDGTTGRSYYDDNCDHLVLKNNILTNMGGGYALSHDTQGTLISNYNNLYVYPETNILALWQGSFKDDLQELFDETGQDENSISEDPDFVSNTDLHLKETSPGQGIGDPDTGISTDIDGDMRDGSNPDMGADEYDIGQGARVGNIEQELITAIDEKVQIHLYPNPIKEELNVRFANIREAQDFTISVVDVSGKVISSTVKRISQGESTITLATDRLASGLYTVLLTSKNEMVTVRVVK